MFCSIVSRQTGKSDRCIFKSDLIRNDNSNIYFNWNLSGIQDTLQKRMLSEYRNIGNLTSCIKQQTTVSFDDWSRHPYGLDKVIISYLFGNSPDPAFTDAPSSWRKAAFFDDLSTNQEVSNPCSMISRLLYTVRREPCIENRIDWMYKSVTRDPDCSYALSANLVLYGRVRHSVFCIIIACVQERCGIGLHQTKCWSISKSRIVDCFFLQDWFKIKVKERQNSTFI